MKKNMHQQGRRHYLLWFSQGVMNAPNVSGQSVWFLRFDEGNWLQGWHRTWLVLSQDKLGAHLIDLPGTSLFRYREDFLEGIAGRGSSTT